jgi:hypothetical protein
VPTVIRIPCTVERFAPSDWIRPIDNVSRVLKPGQFIGLKVIGALVVAPAWDC